MSGICGVINLDLSPVREENVRKMMKTMKHRGPDGETVLVEGNTGFGLVSLNTTNREMRPHNGIVYHEGRYVVVHDGAVFNYSELREELIRRGHAFVTAADAEVILASYLEWGEECQHRFNGMWAFLIYDRLNRKLFASRDRYGIKPLYYQFDGSRFACASEIPALLALPGNQAEPDGQSLYDFMLYNRTDYSERTFFSGIKSLRHGHSLTLDLEVPFASGKIVQLPAKTKPYTLRRWYDLREQVRMTEGFSSAGEFRELLISSISRRIKSDRPIGACLSGGLDSSSIVSLLLDQFKMTDLQTFSAVYQKGEFGDETEFINEYREQVKYMFFTRPTADTLYNDLDQFVSAMAEPVPSTNGYAQYKVMELAKDYVAITLDGQGADEILGGYHYFFGVLHKQLITRFRLADAATEIYHYLKKHRSLFGLQSLLFFMLSPRIKERLKKAERGYIKRDFAEQYSDSSLIASALYDSGSLQDALFDHFEYKLEHLLKWEDRNSMHFSLEARVPFLDHRIVEKMLASDWKKIIYRGTTKVTLREAMKGRIPEKIRNRQDKMGFGTPQNEWFRTPAFRKLVKEIISQDNYLTSTLIDRNVAERLYNRYCEGRIDISKEICKWITIEKWYRSHFS